MYANICNFTYFALQKNLIMVRVRFAPSPTGPLHIGGVRTALYNYLFAKKLGGTFILRIEDTDQTRYVPGAEQYIIDSLNWLGLHTDEDPVRGGDFGPYRQSDRKELYHKYALQLVEQGDAYYAFDSADDLEKMRQDEKEKGNHTPKYDHKIRMQMKNSLTLSAEEVERLKAELENVTIRLKIPSDQTVTFNDLVRGDVSFQTNELDDKVILKADGMPTYHLANIVDDHSMQISHVIRGEEWLSSTAHHVLMYQFFNWTPPQFAHLPLILKPTGAGKLSKRDGAKFGFPVFPLNWDGDEFYEGFKEAGFLPSALKNFLAMLGWNPGTEQEMFTMEQLIETFSIEKIVKSGARFDFDKAKWFNQQYIIASDNSDLAELVKPYLAQSNYEAPSEDFLLGFIELMKERVISVSEFASTGYYFFEGPKEYDEKTAKKKWKTENREHFDCLVESLASLDNFDTDSVQSHIKGYISEKELSFGAILPIIRIAVSGTMKGPDIFGMISLLGKEESVARLKSGIELIQSLADANE